MRKFVLLTLLFGMIGSSYAEKNKNEADAAIVKKIADELLRVRPDMPIEAVVKSPVPGFYEVQLSGGQLLHMTEDAKYLFSGELYELMETELVNVSERVRTESRQLIMGELDESQMWLFAPPSGLTKATVTVFTDIDCVFCRKLHQEVPELNRLGIAVRYMAFPRAGLKSASYDKLVSAWCADKPKLALTRAKNGQSIEPMTCENPIASQYELGNSMGVNSTPALIFEDGTLSPGYLPARDLALKLGVL